MATIDEMTAIIQRYAEIRQLRQATGIGLLASELRIHGADQIPLLMEHVERGDHRMTIANPIFGLPVIYDEAMPIGVVRFVMEDGSIRDIAIA